MSLNHVNSLFGTESFRRYLQNSLVKDVKVDVKWKYYVCRVLKPLKLFLEVMEV